MSPILSKAIAGFLLFSATSGNPVPLWTPGLPEAPPPTYSVAMTAYNAVPSQTDGDPLTTASGALSDPDIIAARSWDLAEEMPFGTVIEIGSEATATPGCGLELVHPKIGLRVIGDTMNARMHNKIDVLFHSDSHVRIKGKNVSVARALGICKDVEVRVVGRIDPNHMPKSQGELAAMLSKEFAMK